MNNKAVIIAIVIIVALAGLWWFNRGAKPEVAPEPNVVVTAPDIAVTATNTANVVNSTTTPTQTPTVKEFIISGSNFKFDVPTITVNKDDTVRITFKNAGGTHDFVIDEFKVKTKILNSNQQETIEFVADKAGRFEYYCSVGNHRAMGMKGVLVVK